MRKSSLLPVLSLGLAVAVTVARGAELRLCAAPWPPFTVATEGGVAGLHARRVAGALAALGHQASIDAIPWERCLKELADGRYAAAYGAPYRQDWESFAVYAGEPLDRLTYVAVVRRGEGGGWDRHRDLRQLPQPVGLPRGRELGPGLDAHRLAVDDGAQGDEQNLRKLLAGRIGTAAVEAGAAMPLLARGDTAGKLVVLGQPLAQGQKVYVLVSRRALAGGAQQLAASISARLAADGAER